MKKMLMLPIPYISFKWLIVLPTFILIYLAYGVYFFITGGPTSSFEIKVQNQIRSDITNGLNRVSLEKIIDLNWTYICMAAPYISKDEISKATNKITKEKVKEIAWSSHDGFWTILFVNDKQVVPVRVPRLEMGDYSLEGHPIKCIAIDNGQLKIERKFDDKLIRVIFILESI